MNLMDFHKLSSEIIPALRGKRSQQQMSHLMGYTFNQVHRWETGKTRIKWNEFLHYCQLTKAPLTKSIKEAFTYFGDLADQKKLLRHFLGPHSIATLCKELNYSPSTFSRMLNGKTEVTLDQVLQIMDFGSIDFLRFIEILCKGAPLPEITKKSEIDHKFLKLYGKYPWLSILMSALDQKIYKQNPKDEFLAAKTKIPLTQVREALKELESLDLIKKVNGAWQAQLFKISMRGDLADRKKIAQYVCATASASVESSFGNPSCRHSWKHFSLNQKNYEKMLQKYTEFFNDLGRIIDEGQEDADKIYQFSAFFVDFDEIK